MTQSILVEIAPGELIDKITILEIKAERISDAEKRANVLVELQTLADARVAAILQDDEIVKLTVCVIMTHSGHFTFDSADPIGKPRGRRC